LKKGPMIINFRIMQENGKKAHQSARYSLFVQEKMLEKPVSL
jgi:hypothetical protein